MKVPKPLALPHLVLHCLSDPRKICKELVATAKGSAGFNYRSVDNTLMAHIRGSFSREQLEVALRTNAPDGKAELFAELATPLHTAFERVESKFMLQVPQLRLPIPGGLVVPFNPGFAYIPKGSERLIIPSRIYWKSIGLDERQVRLFFSFARELLLEDDDFAEAELQLVTMADDGSGTRTLRKYDSSDFELASPAELNDVLADYRVGFDMAKIELSKLPPKQPSKGRKISPNLDMFN